MRNNAAEMGEVIRSAREAKGMTQNTLAKTANISVRTIRGAESGKRRPSYEVLGKIIHALDLSADHIFRPEKIHCTPGQEQLCRALHTCDKRDQAVFMNIARAYIRAVQDEKGAKKQTVSKPSVFAVLPLVDKMSTGQSDRQG